MKITLNQNIVLKLSIDKKPIAYNDNKIEYVNNTTNAAYIVFDDHSDSPTGFGIKVAKTKKTYIIQRRVPEGKVIKAKKR